MGLAAGDANTTVGDECTRLVVDSDLDFLLGDRAGADAKLKVMKERFGDDYPMGIVEAYALRDERDAAFEWMQRARKVGDPELKGIHNSVFLRNLHKDPRWLPWLRELGIAPEQLAKIKFEVKLPETVAR